MINVICILFECGWDPYKFNLWKDLAGNLFARDKSISPNVIIASLIKCRSLVDVKAAAHHHNGGGIESGIDTHTQHNETYQK